MKYKIKDYADLEQRVNGMEVDELLRTIICPAFLLGQTKPRRSTPTLMFHPCEKAIAAKEAEELNRDRTEKALIASDMEYGAALAIPDAVAFPSMRAAGESGDPELAYRMGEVTAKEALQAGYHWTFAPCVDILGNRANPIVSIRTAGEDAETVLRYGGAYMRGLQDHGLIATLKHFPGDGFCADDQHITTTENPLTKEEWDASFGMLYRALIEDGAKSIMPGHISLPAYDEPDPETGLYPPATLSKRLLTDLLRGELGFEGIIISDAISMGGFCSYMNLYRACAVFLEAGGDCLLFMSEKEEYFTEMKKHIASGLLRVDTLRNRAYRLLCFAREYFEDADRHRALGFDADYAEEISRQMVEKSMKVVRDRAGLLPFSIGPGTRIVHAALYNPATDGACAEVSDLTEKLTALGAQVEEWKDPGSGRLRDAAKSGEYDLIICSVLNKPAWGMNCAKLSGPMARNMMNGWMRYGTPVLFVSYYDSYFGDTFAAPVDTLINTYGYCKHTNGELLKRIMGKDKM